jgi:hypothetical protein
MVVTEKAGCIECVSECSQSKGPTNSKDIGNGAGVECNDSEGSIESGLSNVKDVRIKLSGSTKPTQRVITAWV